MSADKINFKTMPENQSFEREKWLKDVEFREREILIREREQGNRDTELKLKEREHRASAWRNPLTVAIFAAAVAAAGNAVVAVVNGSLQRDLDSQKRNSEFSLERSKAESTRILEMIKTGDPERAAANLEFLLQSGLIIDEGLSTKVEAYLKNRRPGSGPALPSPSGRLGFEKSDLLTESIHQNLQNILNKYFNYLDNIGFSKPSLGVSLSIEKLDIPNAHYSLADNRIIIDQRMAEDTSIVLRTYNDHVLSESKKNKDVTGPFAALGSGFADYFACSFLNNPNLGEKSAHLFNQKSKLIRTLKNTRTFSDLSKLNNFEMVFMGGEVWGGLFWGIRDKIGASAADSLLARTWLDFEPPADSSQIASMFILALTKAAKTDGETVSDAVRSIIASRKFPLSDTHQ